MEKIAFIEINNYLAKLIIAETKTNAHFNLITRRLVPIEADYIGFTIENKFVLGYGLDDDQNYRNLNYIGYIEE